MTIRDFIGPALWMSFGILVVFLITNHAYFLATHHCVSSHVETELKMPAYINASSEGGGGISLPIGNARYVERTVCDEYAPD